MLFASFYLLFLYTAHGTQHTLAIFLITNGTGRHVDISVNNSFRKFEFSVFSVFQFFSHIVETTNLTRINDLKKKTPNRYPFVTGFRHTISLFQFFEVCCMRHDKPFKSRKNLKCKWPSQTHEYRMHTILSVGCCFSPPKSKRWIAFMG